MNDRYASHLDVASALPRVTLGALQLRSEKLDDALDVLRAIDLLDGVDDAGLAAVADTASIMFVDAHEIVVRQGEWDETCFVVVRGGLSVIETGADGRSHAKERLGPGRYFGELALIGRGDRAATVLAEEPTTLIELRRVPFSAAVRKHRQVRARLERRYELHVLSNTIRASRTFRELPSEIQQRLAESAALVSAAKGDVVIAEGASVDSLYVVRSGNARVSRKLQVGQDEQILAYLGPYDLFGDQELSSAIARYGASLVALEPLEALVIPRAMFFELEKAHPDLLPRSRRYQLVRREQQSMLGPTSMSFVKDVLESGLAQARSALVINLEACVRCGNCVQACADTYGYSRLARRGKRLTRRVELLAEGQHESLYFPTSCLHCATPECMVGCPSGSIARGPGGEIFIRDTCVGCGSCARNCDFGNISIAKLVSGDRTEQIAVKCDVCFERSSAACVDNCPTQALQRVDPNQYFDELAQLAPQPTAERDAKTTTERPRRWLDAVAPPLILLLSVISAYAVWRQGLLRSPWWTGAAAGLCVIALGAIGARKRLRTAPLGPLHRWVRVHTFLGSAFFGLALLHAGFGARSVLGATLLGTLLVVGVIGALGQLAGFVIPRLLARAEDEAMLPEDRTSRIAALRRENEELLASLPSGSLAMTRAQVKRFSHGTLGFYAEGLSPKQIGARVAERARRTHLLPEREQAIARRIAENELVWRLHALSRAVELSLTLWVPLHLVGACVGLLLMVGHVIVTMVW